MRRILFTITLVVGALTAHGQLGYPSPPDSDKMLFFIQRSHNQNTIIYDLNINPDGKVDSNMPLNIYWIRYEEGGHKKALSYLQLKAFGANCKLIDKEKKSYIICFNHFDLHEVLLSKSITGKYRAYIKINDELAELKSVFVLAENNALGMPLSIEYVELKGVSLKSKCIISERVTQ